MRLGLGKRLCCCGDGPLTECITCTGPDISVSACGWSNAELHFEFIGLGSSDSCDCSTLDGLFVIDPDDGWGCSQDPQVFPRYPIPNVCLGDPLPYMYWAFGSSNCPGVSPDMPGKSYTVSIFLVWPEGTGPPNNFELGKRFGRTVTYGEDDYSCEALASGVVIPALPQVPGQGCGEGGSVKFSVVPK